MDWYVITRLGNSMLMMPAALAIAVGLCQFDRWRLAALWSACFAAAVLLVLATKVAFLGFGIGSRLLDFTGISGHSTLAAAVFPVLGWWLAQGWQRAVQRAAIAAGFCLALAIGWSRLALDTHSPSEVVIGLALGFTVAGMTMSQAGLADRVSRLAQAVGLALLIAGGVPVEREFAGAHGLVVKIALHLSGRSEVFTRDML